MTPTPEEIVDGIIRYGSYAGPTAIAVMRMRFIDAIRAAEAAAYQRGQEEMRARCVEKARGYGDRVNKDQWTITHTMAGERIADVLEALPLNPTPETKE